MLMLIIGYVDLAMNNAELPDGARSSLESALVAANRGSKLIDELLTGGAPVSRDRETCGLNECVSSEVALFAEILDDEIALELHLDWTANIVQVPPQQLGQALMNLLLNACAAMPDGGTLTITTGRALSCDGSPGVMVDVADTGLGVSDEIKSKIFEPFFTTNASAGGTGLGLATALSLVGQLGGDITVASTPQAGTQFRVWLPLPAGASPALIGGPGGEYLAGVALVADDDRGIRRRIAAVLQRDGYEVHEAEDGAHALTIAEALETNLSLVVTDIHMPRINGVRVADAIQVRHPNVPVLLVTGYADSEREAPSRAVLPKPVLLMSGFVDLSPTRGPGRGLLHKPFSNDDLRNAIRSLSKR